MEEEEEETETEGLVLNQLMRKKVASEKQLSTQSTSPYCVELR